MGKIMDAIKKPAKKVAVKKVIEEVEEKVEVSSKCDGCNGRGLLDQHNLCVLCDGSGQK